MSLAEIIVKYGARAVLDYRAMAGLAQDNELPEIYISGFIASGIFGELGLNAHVERLYTVIASELGVQINANVILRFGGHRADVAVYKGKTPIAIIELKKFSDAYSSAKIRSDREKMQILAELCGIETYLGVLVTDTQNDKSCLDRTKSLETKLERNFDVVGDKISSLSGKWNWCFVSGRTNGRAPV